MSVDIQERKVRKSLNKRRRETIVRSAVNECDRKLHKKESQAFDDKKASTEANVEPGDRMHQHQNDGTEQDTAAANVVTETAVSSTYTECQSKLIVVLGIRLPRELIALVVLYARHKWTFVDVKRNLCRDGAFTLDSYFDAHTMEGLYASADVSS